MDAAVRRCIYLGQYGSGKQKEHHMSKIEGLALSADITAALAEYIADHLTDALPRSLVALGATDITVSDPTESSFMLAVVIKSPEIGKSYTYHLKVGVS